MTIETEDEEGAVGGTLGLEDMSKYTVSMQNLLRLSAEMPAPTPASTPASTPTSTPAQSPVRSDKSVKSRVVEPMKKKGKKDEDPGVVLITYKGSNIPDKKLSHSVRVDYLRKSKVLKYIYQNKQYNPEIVREHIMHRKIDLANIEIFRVDRTQFDKLVMGQYLELHLGK